MEPEEIAVEEEELKGEARDAMTVLEETLARIARGESAHNMIEISDAIVYLQTVYGKTQEWIAEKTGASQSTISNYYSLRLLIPVLRRRAKADEMTYKAAVRLSKMSPEDQQAVYDRTLDKRRVDETTVKAKAREEVEELPFGSINPPLPPKRVIDIELPSIKFDLLSEEGEVEYEYGGAIIQITLV